MEILFSCKGKRGRSIKLWGRIPNIPSAPEIPSINDANYTFRCVFLIPNSLVEEKEKLDDGFSIRCCNTFTRDPPFSIMKTLEWLNSSVHPPPFPPFARSSPGIIAKSFTLIVH